MKHQIALPMVRTLDRWEHALLSFSVSCITFRLHIQSVLSLLARGLIVLSIYVTVPCASFDLQLNRASTGIVPNRPFCGVHKEQHSYPCNHGLKGLKGV